MDIGDRIRARREELGLSQEELSKKIGYKSKSSINKIELGQRVLTQSKIKAIADALETTPSYIMGWDDAPTSSTPTPPPGLDPMPEMQLLPMMGEIACGAPTYAEGVRQGFAEAPAHIRADFTLICKGNSMIDAGIRDGDTVYIRQQSIVENGQIAAVAIDGDTTLKKVYLYDDMLVLRPCNEAYPERILRKEEMNDAVIEGLAVGWTHMIYE